MSNRSKYLSLILRHKPEIANLTLDKEGFVDIKTLIANTDFSIEEIQDIVAFDEKKRYFISNGKIRASQGHSIKNLELDYKVVVPPKILYHGTKQFLLPIILKEGLKSMNRTHVHLSDNIDTALVVANRRKGKSVILKINTEKIKDLVFYLSENNVFLCKEIPPQYIEV